MTTLMVVDGDRGESRSQAVARRLRGELGELRISVSEVARRINMTQAALSRRMTGDVEFGVNLLDEICKATGISYAYVTSGIKEAPRPRPDGGSEADGGYSAGRKRSEMELMQQGWSSRRLSAVA